MNRPGEFKITDRAMEICQVKPGGTCLEIGCGEGQVTERLEKKYGLNVEAIDISLEKVSKAKERNLKANIRYGDGEFLEDFTSNTMDLVVIECVLSLINLPDEALHEIYCVLKKGGKLILSDVSVRDPEEKDVEKTVEEAKFFLETQKEYLECNDHKDPKRPVAFRIGNRLLPDQLSQTLEEMGFEVLASEDRTEDLKDYVAHQIMDGKGEDLCQEYPKDTGYFLIVAQKK